MSVFLSLLPILLILFLMVGLRWGAARAGAAGYLAAFFLAVVFFGARAELLAYAHVKALLLAFEVLYIVWAAYLHYRVADEAGAIRTIGEALPGLTGDKGMLALLLGFAFTSFLQGVGGFGVPVAVVAPLMVGLGFSPLSAAVIPSVGHGWAVTFGSLGASFQALLSATGLTEAELAGPAALFLGLAGLLSGYMTVHAADGWQAVRRLWLPVLLLGAGMGGVQYAMAVSGLWNIAAAGAGVVGMLAAVGVARVLAPRGGSELRQEGAGLRGVGVALSAYLILIAITLAVQLIPPVKEWLGRAALSVPFPELSTAAGFTTPAGTGRPLRWFAHGGALLVYAAALGYAVYRRAGLYAPGAAGRILSSTARGVMNASVSILTMVMMAVIMAHAGMTDALAQGLAGGVGRLFPVAAGWIGALGAFMTGSNTNSNVVFSLLQMRTAELLAFSVPWILAAQTAGGALGSIIAPTKIVVGAATAGVEGREGEVILKLGGYVLALLGLVSLMSVAAQRCCF